MTTYDVVAQLKRDVGVSDQSIERLTDVEATIAELITERRKATAALRKRLEAVEADFNAELDDLVDGKVHASACGSYCFRIFKRGDVVKVSTEDALHLMAVPGQYVSIVNGYAVVKKGTTNKRLSHLVLPPKKGFLVDHANGQTLDNRRTNLRLATPSQNRANSRRNRAFDDSAYPGVTKNKFRGEWTGRWQAALMFKGQRRYLGSFDTEVEAAYAYHEEAVRLYGDFALTAVTLDLLPQKIQYSPLIASTDTPLSLVEH